MDVDFPCNANVMKEPSKEELESRRAEIVVRVEREKKLRRAVYEAITSLLDEDVAEEQLLKRLCHLDCGSWDEIVEERYLSKLCGWPLCTTPVSHNRRMQKYHIDRVEKKVYEVCSARAKFCCSACFERSVSLRSQLPTEALWITGPRPAKNYDLHTPIMISSSKNWNLTPKEFTIVPDKVVAQLSDLRVAEGNDDSDSETEDMAENEKVTQRTAEDDEFAQSIKRFVTNLQQTQSSCTTGSELSKKASSPKVLPQHQSIREEEKLRRLRDKYGTERGRRTRKLPIALVDAPTLSGGQLETEPIRAVSSRSKSPSSRALRAPKPTAELWKNVEKIVRGWISDRTRELIRVGGARVRSETDRILRQFYAGDYAYRENCDVVLPKVDFVDQHRQRCDILQTALKRSWLSMEHHLGLSRKYTNELAMLVRSFELTADNVAGFSTDELRAISIVLWRLVDLMFVDECDHHFEDGNPSDVIREHIRELRLDFDTFCLLLKDLEQLLENGDSSSAMES